MRNNGYHRRGSPRHRLAVASAHLAASPRRPVASWPSRPKRLPGKPAAGLLVFTAERAHLIHPRRVTRVAPDLAVEVLSPGTARNDRGRKRDLLARHAVREYWLVDPDVPRIEVFALQDGALVASSTAEGSESVTSPLLPSLALRPVSLIPSA